MRIKRVGVIGAGASGMTAAVAAAWQGASVTVLEKGERVGKKLLMTGNGKCNLGNELLRPDRYHGGNKEWVGHILCKFGTEDTVRFFHRLGLLLKSKNGYLYPMCEQASVVLDVLRNELMALDIDVITECGADRITQNEKTGEWIVLSDSRRFVFDSVILACGSRAMSKTGSDGSGYDLAKQLGHRLIPVVPALVQLRCREEYLKAVAGVRAEGSVSVYRDGRRIVEERGEIQFTDYGISGIPVFQISRFVNYLLQKQKEVDVVINLMPDYEEDSFEQFCAGRSLLQSGRTVEEFFTGILNKKLMTLFAKLAGLKPGMPMEQAAEDSVHKVYELCRSFRLHVTGSNSFDHAQVCAGGVDTAQVTENLESVLCPGIFFAGEILDVDGMCGGYNLQWAWSSGYLAGSAAAGRTE